MQQAPGAAEAPETVILVPGPLSDREGRRLLEEIVRAAGGGASRIALDLSELERLDSRGCAWLIRAVRAARRRGAQVGLRGECGEAAEVIELLSKSFAEDRPRPPASAGFLESLGNKAFRAREELLDAWRLAVDAVYWSFIAPFEGRGLRWKGLVTEIEDIGIRAIGIVSLLNFLLGLVIAMLSAAQASTFGVQIYVASLVVMGFARELAPIMTGIVVSARTGSAIAAELATMKVYEEIDALKGMGLSVSKFLIAPKVLATLVAVPILTAIGFVTGVAGGFFLNAISLDFTFDRWWEQTIQASTVRDLVQGGVKAFSFAVIIVMVGCHNGLRVTGGVRGVGMATTRAVVMDVFLIVVADLLFTTIFYYFL
ncbi:MAG: ABC transporter permease [Candidatus Aureabacteria bacterium]|nr:ABC transporter permease [Candidatus Auribacterota bacterium]NLW94053.1 STAS domain-containing protein [Chlamydiota bacterium]HOE27019.1 ABC transporter permease [bacterium]